MISTKILFVDDDENLLAAIQRSLRKQFNFDTALGGLQALEHMRTKGPYAVIVSDMSMPGMNGAEFLERARRLAPETVRIMLTGNADQQTAADAVNRGHVFRFLSKPCPPETLVPAIEHGLKQYQMLQMERDLLEGTLTVGVGIGARERLGRKRCIARGLRQRLVQFGRAQCEHPDQRQIGFVGGGRHGIAAGCGAVVFEVALQILE